MADAQAFGLRQLSRSDVQSAIELDRIVVYDLALEGSGQGQG